MANFKAKDADAASQEFAADGAGTGGDPFIPHKIAQQATHDNLNANANLQVGDADVANGNPVPAVLVTGTASIPVSIETDNANIQYTEDDVSAANPVGNQLIGRRRDALSSEVGADGDVIALNSTEYGEQYTKQMSFVDSGNSTTAPLGGGAVFTGTGVDLLGFRTIVCTLDASHDSATDGMTFQFSTDNVNWDDVYSFTYTAGSARRFQFPVTAQYFRIVYTNGGTLQTHFRVQTILHTGNQLTSIHRLVDNTNPDRSAQVVKSALIAQINGTGDFTPIQSTASGVLKIGGSVDVDDISAGTQTNDVKITLDGEIVSAVLVTGTAAIPITDGGGTLTVDQATHDNLNTNANLQFSDVDVNNDNPLPTVLVSGTATIPVSAASLPLPSGAATAANQLADGHNVTVDNAAGGSAVNIQDGGNSLTVDQSTHDNLNANANLQVGDVDVGGANPVPVSATSLPLPTGAATSAAQLPDGHNVTVDNATGGSAVNVQDGGNSLTVDNTNLDAFVFGLQEASVGLSVAHVTGTSISIRIDEDNVGIGGGTQYTEDVAAAGDPVGSAQILIRQDTPAALVTTDGDNVARRGTNFGAAFSQILDSSGNFIDSFGGGTQYTEGDTDVTIVGTAIMWEDAADTLRAVSDAKPLPVDLGSRNDVTLATLPDTAATDLALQTADLDTLAGAVSAGQMQVDIVADGAGLATAANQLANGHDVTVDNAAGASAVNIQDGGNDISVDFGGTVPTVSNAALQSTGDEAHDAPDAGNPVKVGHKAIAHGTNPTAVAANDRSDWYANRHGVPWVIGGHPNIVTIRANYTGAQTDTAIVTVAGGLKIVVTRCSVTADNANSVDVQARVGFGATNTPTTTGVVLSHPGIAPGSGVVEGSGSGMLGVGADGEDLRITSEVPTGGSIDVVVSYYTVES